MGIGRNEFQLLLNEHNYRPITGKVISIGRQTCIQQDVAADILDMFGMRPRDGHFIDFDGVTLHEHRTGQLTDKSLFSLFSDAEVFAADVSKAEGADYEFDICGDVPEHLVGHFDFVMDGGSLDNVFDVVRMIANLSRMLKPGGRMMLTPWVNSHPTAYVKVSPDWAADYFAVNEYTDCKAYLMIGRLNGSRATMWNYEPGRTGAYEISNVISPNISQLLAIAEKGERSTDTRTAIQWHYRGGNVEPYMTSAARWRASPRPMFRFPVFNGDGWREPVSNGGAITYVATSS